MSKSNDENFFDKFSIGSSESSELVLGKVYPLYGQITEFLEEDVENSFVLVRAEPNMELRLNVDSQEKLTMLKERAFDCGIFVTCITEKPNGDGTRDLLNLTTNVVETKDILEDRDKLIVGNVSTVVFGRKQQVEVQ